MPYFIFRKISGVSCAVGICVLVRGCVVWRFVWCKRGAQSWFYESVRLFKNVGEQNITLVVDTVYNKNLRKKYPDIGNLEKELSLINQCDREMHCNPIIVIGFFKENIINSMCLCNNYYLNSDASNPRNNISDIDYEMWYFYKHSWLIACKNGFGL